jgi:hypothetical protein
LTALLNGYIMDSIKGLIIKRKQMSNPNPMHDPENTYPSDRYLPKPNDGFSKIEYAMRLYKRTFPDLNDSEQISIRREAEQLRERQ